MLLVVLVPLVFLVLLGVLCQVYIRTVLVLLQLNKMISCFFFFRLFSVAPVAPAEKKFEGQAWKGTSKQAVTCSYDVLEYAFEPYEAYTREYGGGRALGRALVVGMNPGPWGMVSRRCDMVYHTCTRFPFGMFVDLKSRGCRELKRGSIVIRRPYLLGGVLLYAA